ncbi:MAG: hypothetical protein JWN33_394 [Candidatus Saccharibacteria bacterium]|nr:hypothetical protein [Candidatus Saccharibacteria bacterium]
MATKARTSTSTKKVPVKSAAKRSVSKKKTASKKAPALQSFKLTKEPRPFVSFRPNKQTLYWAILLVFILVTQLWVLKLQLEIVDLTDSILLQNA